MSPRTPNNDINARKDDAASLRDRLVTAEQELSETRELLRSTQEDSQKADEDFREVLARVSKLQAQLREREEQLEHANATGRQADANFTKMLERVQILEAALQAAKGTREDQDSSKESPTGDQTLTNLAVYPEAAGKAPQATAQMEGPTDSTTQHAAQATGETALARGGDAMGTEALSQKTTSVMNTSHDDLATLNAKQAAEIEAQRQALQSASAAVAALEAEISQLKARPVGHAPPAVGPYGDMSKIAPQKSPDTEEGNTLEFLAELQAEAACCSLSAAELAHHKEV